MKEKDTHIESGKITGFFDKNTEIEGTLKFNGSFQIDGHFIGKIESNAVLVIGINGKVESEINIGVIIVNGEVKGNIRAKERVEIRSGGRVLGTITTPSLIVKEGAHLEAQCHTTDKNLPPKTKKPKEETRNEDPDIQERLLS
ncbi:MAG: polymer-forming cytoskeletal protein [Candidatus Aminicenantes bacterium]|nr:polymer-forming cytoskeletal protein [Candidatus Aminicenantes bacterium]